MDTEWERSEASSEVSAVDGSMEHNHTVKNIYRKQTGRRNKEATLRSLRGISRKLLSLSGGPLHRNISTLADGFTDTASLGYSIIQTLALTHTPAHLWQ